ncbi:hypothetical protein JCM18916_2370 [Cutibacterium acnes JCM 18916]|nr:hypothetical protein JCM18916_2370 [Cutibacterium acnes JCM 18916]
MGGRYRLDQEISRPEPSLAWRAFDTKLHRPVLIYALAPHGRRTPAVLDAARRAAVATDSRFLRVLDAVVAGPGEPASWVVSEYAPGKSIEELLETGPLSALEAAWIAHEIADAMAPLHAQGVFHERISPGPSWSPQQGISRSVVSSLRPHCIPGRGYFSLLAGPRSR